jgi:hypothetical protein
MGWKREMAVARSGRRATAAVAVDRAVDPVTPTPSFHDRFLIEEGCAAAFRIDAGGGWATGALPAGADENEIAKFLSEAISLAKQMQTAMSGPSGGVKLEGQAGAAAVHILIVDPQAGVSRQSAIQVSVESSGGTVVTLQPGGGSGHLVTMLQHFLMALNLGPRDATPPGAPPPGFAAHAEATGRR